MAAFAPRRQDRGDSTQKIHGSSLQKVGLTAKRLLEDSLRWSGPNYIVIAAVGIVGFPLYYLVWKSWYPQPYENIFLRLLGAALLLMLILKKRWPSWLKPLFPLYWYLTITYSLPFFFVFMTLMNDGNTVWLLSLMVSFCLLALMMDLLNFLIMSVLGTGSAVVAYRVTTSAPASLADFHEYVAVLLFAIVGFSTFNYRTNVLNREKTKAVARVGSYIAHELRTPLLSIRAGAYGIKKYLPRLTDAYLLSKKHGLPVPEIRDAHFRELSAVLNRIAAETEYSNIIIDMLLSSTQLDIGETNEYSVISMQSCIETALERYPFKAGERDRITFHSKNDFSVFGSPLLMVHVLFNLLKNSLDAIRAKPDGAIEIGMDNSNNSHYVTILDNGKGIALEAIPYIFRPFYSNNQSDAGGTGLGLSFCRLVVESFGGSIHCESEFGLHTKFVLAFEETH